MHKNKNKQGIFALHFFNCFSLTQLIAFISKVQSISLNYQNKSEILKFILIKKKVNKQILLQELKLKAFYIRKKSENFFNLVN